MTAFPVISWPSFNRTPIAFFLSDQDLLNLMAPQDLSSHLLKGLSHFKRELFHLSINTRHPIMKVGHLNSRHPHCRDFLRGKQGIRASYREEGLQEGMGDKFIEKFSVSLILISREKKDIGIEKEEGSNQLREDRMLENSSKIFPRAA